MFGAYPKAEAEDAAKDGVPSNGDGLAAGEVAGVPRRKIDRALRRWRRHALFSRE